MKNELALPRSIAEANFFSVDLIKKAIGIIYVQHQKPRCTVVVLLKKKEYFYVHN